MIKLRDLLYCLPEHDLVEIVNGYVCDGAYRVQELLERNDDILDKMVPKHGVSICVGVAEAVIAEQSCMKNDYFQEDGKVIYLAIEVQ